MLFNSYIYILLFLPITFAGYFILNHFKHYNIASIFIVIASFIFIGKFSIYHLCVLFFSIFINYLFFRLLLKNQNKIICGTGIVFNLLLLLAFKYTNFFISSLNKLISNDFNLLHIILPVGISFYTFSQIAFLIDTYRKESPEYTFLEYLLYVSYFPKIIQGPIAYHSEIIPQFQSIENRKINYENISKGLYVFSLGLAKKVLIADFLGRGVDWAWANIDAYDSATAIIVMLSYTFQIYFDFSGYCDMAQGTSLLFNIKLPDNFDSPYKSFTILDFWKRWHITLTRFFTKYVYIPLGGNRKGTLRTYINILIIFILSGFWHGAWYTFILWGLVHGIFQIITKHFKNFFEKLHPALNWLITFSFINLSWVIFRAPSLTDLKNMIIKILKFRFSDINSTFISSIFSSLNDYLPYQSIFVFLIVLLFLCLFNKNTKEIVDDFKPSLLKSIFFAILMFISILNFSNVSTFLYAFY